MENKQNNNKQKSAAENVVNKVASGERASLGDAPLTPPKKMEAEKEQLKGKTPKAEEGGEVDKQQVNLGSKVLTPEEKSDRARMESRPASSVKAAETNNKEKR